MDHITIIPSKRFIQILQELQNAYGVPDSLKHKISSDICSETSISLTTQEVKWCHTKMRERGIPERVHELLSESEIVLPKYEPPPRNPELEARIQRLRFEQENREYKEMVKSVDPTRCKGVGDLSDIGRDLRSVNKQMVSGMQYLISVVGTFFAIFIIVGWYNPDYGVRALTALISALLVGVAELFFVIREDLREEDRIEKRKNVIT